MLFFVEFSLRIQLSYVGTTYECQNILCERQMLLKDSIVWGPSGWHCLLAISAGDLSITLSFSKLEGTLPLPQHLHFVNLKNQSRMDIPPEQCQ